MDNAKIEIKIGIVEFTGEGEQEWLGKQLDKVLEKIPDLLRIELANPNKSNHVPISETTASTNNATVQTTQSNAIPTNLPTFLRDKNASSSQVNKFLVTAVFLQLNGKTRISTTDVAQTLKNSNQSKLANASDTLNQNVGKGYCEKDGSQFFVTQEGLNFVEQLK